MFQCYFDASGTELDPRVIVTAGVVATATKWARFDQRWNAALAEFGVTAFHMKEFAHFKEEFAAPEWRDGARRNAFVERLCKEAKRGINKHFVQAVVLTDYREADKLYQVTETYGSPYTLAQAVCVISALEWLNNKHPQAHVQFFVERGDIGQGEFMKFMRQQAGFEPTLIPKVDAATGKPWTPLQAADFVAYEYRKLYDRIIERGAVPPQSAWRESLKCLRRMLPIEAHVHYAGTLKELHDIGTIPAR